MGAHLVGTLQRQKKAVRGVTSQECNLERINEVRAYLRQMGSGPHQAVLLSVINKDRDNSFESFQRNVTMVQNFMEGIQALPMEGLVYFSSVDVYGRAPGLPLTEDSPIDPDTWYGISKAVGEWIVRTQGAGRFPVSVLRIPGIYGAGPNDRSVIGRLCAEIQKNQVVVVNGSGSVLRDYVYVQDVCSLVGLCLEKRYDGTLNVAVGKSLSLREIVQWIGQTLGKKVEMLKGPADAQREFDLVFNNKKLSAAFPDFSFTPFQEGIRSYFP